MFGNTSFSFGNTSNAFGSNNNNNNNSMFGNNNNNNSLAFGNTGFGNSSRTTFGNSSFGNNSSNFSSSAFGNSTFVNNSSFNSNTSVYGSTSFGSSSAFGKTNSTSAFGSFGNTSNNTSAFGTSSFGNNNTSGFGSSGFGNSSSSAFGKTGFGNNTSSAFGGGMNSFGSNNNTSSFGNSFGSNNNSFGGGFGNNNTNENNGTGNPKYQQQVEKDGNSFSNVSFNSITAMPAYRNFSFEELRVKDYMLGKKGPSMGMGNSSVFGSSSTSAFGNMNNQRSAFGNTGFGSSMNNLNLGFGTSSFGNNNQNTSGFGGFGNNNNNNSFSTNNSNAFGNNRFGSSGFGNSGFGNNNNNNNNNGSVFGQSSFGSNAFNKPSTGAFGTSNSNAFGSTGFGSNNNSNNAFGSNSFSNQSTGFGFGNNNSTNNAFGQTTNTSAFSNGFKLNNNNNNTQTNGFFGQNNNNNQNSLFGNNSNNNNNNNNNSLFGQSNTTTNTSTQSNSLFGNNTNNSTGMNNTGFGFKSSSGFGTVNTATSNPTTATSSFGTTNSLFSKPNVSTPAQSTLQTTTPQTTFGSTNVSKPLTSNTSLFSSSNTTSKTTFGFNTASTTTTTTTTTTSLTTLTKTNTGPNTLTATPNNTTIKKTEQNQITVSKQEPQITPIIEKNKPLRKKTQSMIVPRKMSSKMKIREYNSEVQDTESSLSEDENSKSNDVTYKKKNNRISKDIQKLLDDFEKEAKENKFKEEVSFNEIKEQTEKLKIEDKKEQSNDTLSGKLTENRINSIRLFQEPDTFVNESDTNDNDDKEKSVKINEESIHSKGSVNKRLSSRRISMNTEYEVNPPISQLLKMTDEELCNVKNLEVYVKNVGSLKFLQPVDLLSACNGKKRENIPYIFGNIIIIQPKSCTVYPDDRVKPEVGQGLNQPAIIELYSCWAKDKSTGKPILDPSLPSYKKHLIHLKNIKDTEFIDYEALQGKWTFKVEHFTRYGLFTDDDDEDDDLEKILINNKKDLIIKKKINGNINRGYGLISTDDDSSENDVNNLNVVLNQQNNKTLVVTEVLSEDDIEQKNKLDSMKYCFNTMENAKKLQVMNVSIFGSLNNGRKHYSLKPINYSEDIIPLNKSRMNKRIEKLKKLRLINKSDVDSIKSTTKVDAKTLNNFKKNFEEDKKLIKNSISHDTPVFSLKPKTENQSNTEKELSNLSNISTEDLDKLDIIQNNLESIPFYKNSIFHEYFDKYKNNQVLNSLVFYFLKSRGFRVGWGQNNTIAIPSVNSSNNNKIQLGAVDVCKINFDPDRANHVILLNSILKFTKIEHDKNKLNENSGRVITNPYIVREKSNKIFTNLINSINSNTFNKNEILMWKLCQILFDNNEINELEECEDILSKEQKQYIIAMQKKQNIGKWLKESLTDTINHSLEVIRAKLENIKMSEEEGENSQKAKELIIKLIFIHLTGNNNRNACKEALNYKENRLALLISQQASCNEDVTDKKVIARGVPGSGKTDNYYMDMIKSQVNIWNDGDRDDNEENDLKSVMKILSGQIEVSLLKDLVDWKQVLGLIFWFKNGGSLSFSEALEHFDSLMESLESDRSINPSLFKYKEDIIYYLFKYYVQRDYSRSKILLPKNNSNSKLDYRISWLLNQLLPQGDKERNEREEEKLNNKLTYSYIFQLESIGLWEWACFVAMHIKDSSGREIMIRRLLVQHFPLNSNDDGVSTINYIVSRHPEIKYIRGTLNNQNNIDYWHFLVDNLQIPKIWIYDAKRIKAKYNGDLLREICYTIDCEKYEEAHRLITEDLASDLIIQHKYDLLYDILDNLKQKRSTIENANDKMKNWELNGGLYLDFIEFNDIFTTHKSIDKQLHDYQSNIFDLEETSASVGNSTHLLNSNVDKADIDDNLKNTSQLLNRIYDKKKEMSRNKPNHYEKIMQGLEIMEEILMTAYYTYNELKVEKRSLDTQKGVQEAREDAMEADDGSLLEFDHQAQNYQLLSETSLTDTKREQMIDQLTDQWFNTILDL